MHPEERVMSLVSSEFVLDEHFHWLLKLAEIGISQVSPQAYIRYFSSEYPYPPRITFHEQLGNVEPYAFYFWRKDLGDITVHLSFRDPDGRLVADIMAATTEVNVRVGIGLATTNRLLKGLVHGNSCYVDLPVWLDSTYLERRCCIRQTIGLSRVNPLTLRYPQVKVSADGSFVRYIHFISESSSFGMSWRLEGGWSGVGLEESGVVTPFYPEAATKWVAGKSYIASSTQTDSARRDKRSFLNVLRRR